MDVGELSLVDLILGGADVRLQGGKVARRVVMTQEELNCGGGRGDGGGRGGGVYSGLGGRTGSGEGFSTGEGRRDGCGHGGGVVAGYYSKDTWMISWGDDG